jgi:methylated-DNA-[protein]-cysteine S-methyltransferase
MCAATRFREVPSPIGPLLLTAAAAGLTGLWVNRERPIGEGWRRDDAALAPVAIQLEEYFAGTRRAFDVVLAPRATPFQRLVWDELVRIPYGSRTTYRAVATRIGRPTAIRAMGHANGANPISILVPCHRVVGAVGSLTGYGGGLAAKRWLLEHEARVAGTA